MKKKPSHPESTISLIAGTGFRTLCVLSLSAFLLHCDKKKEPLVIGEPSRPEARIQADSTPADSAPSAHSGSNASRRLSGYFLIDSLGLVDSLAEAEPVVDSANLLKAADLEKPIYGTLRGAQKFDSLLYNEGCTGEDVHYRVYVDGVEEILRGEEPDMFAFSGEALKPFGIASGDSMDKVYAKYGKPRKAGASIVLYVSDQEGDQRPYFDNKWKMYILLENGRVRKLVFQKFMDDC